jgi:hypothetical protein
LPTLRHGHNVILHNLGHTTDTWNCDKPAADRLINTFIDTGRVDQSGYTPRPMSFHSSPTHTLLAKIILAALGGPAAVTIAALLWLPLSLRKRDHLGGKTGIVTRTAVAPLVGLGGWSIGLLLALTLRPSESLAYAPLTVLSIGAPVALAVYVAWVHRTWSHAIRNAGLCATAGGAALGAWLGPHAVSGQLGVLSAVLGAVLGSNLAVLPGTPA